MFARQFEKRSKPEKLYCMDSIHCPYGIFHILLILPQARGFNVQ
jgi:hypothetical protein